jgi:hypothetical protein
MCQSAARVRASGLSSEWEAGLDALDQRLRGLRLVLDEQGGLRGDVKREQAVDGLRITLRHPQRGRIEQLDGGESGCHELRQRAGRGVEIPEHEQPGGELGQRGQGVERRRRHERQRPLAADHEVQQDVDCPLVVDEGVDPVAHGVLDRVEGGDAGEGIRVAAHAIPQPQQALVQLGLERAQPDVGIRLTGVDDHAARKHEHRGLERAVRVELGAARHPAGVVGDDPADRARALAGRIRPELAVVRRQPSVHGPHRRARLDAHAQPAVEHLDLAEVPAGVDQDSGR